MTTPIDSTSPFAGSVSASKDLAEISSGAEEFSIHTMQDDLLNLQKNPEPIKNITANEAPKKIILTPITNSEPQKIMTAPKSMPAPAPIPTPQKATTEPKNKPDGATPFIKQTAMPSKKELAEMPLPEKKATSVNFRKIVLFVTGTIIVVAIILGGYYFLFGRSIPKTTTVQPIENQQSEEVPSATNITTEKYSSEKPNYLSLDIATLSSEDIKKAIADVAEELKTTAKKQLPYEFMVVDMNNNPVAFPIFAIAAKLNLSPIILKNLGENFSLFLYNDNGNERLSVVVGIKDKKILASELLKQEKTFTTDASFLFLNEKSEITKGSFQNSSYKNNSIRFLNVNSQITMSIDYVIINDKLVIATSKNTVRVIIDNLTTPAVVN